MNRAYRRSKLKEQRRKNKEDMMLIKMGIELFQLYKAYIKRF